MPSGGREARLVRAVSVGIVVWGGALIVVAATGGVWAPSAACAKSETVASLRKRSPKAVGHVGDHDDTQAPENALVLFPAQHVLVFAGRRYAPAHRHAVMRAKVDVPVDIVDVTA